MSKKTAATSDDMVSATVVMEFMARYVDRYLKHVEKARLAACTTDTAAWRANYKAQMKHHDAIVTEATNKAQAAINTIAEHGDGEDTEKQLKEAAKELSDERIRHEAWMERSVKFYRMSVVFCQEVISDALAEANNMQTQSPLTHAGMAKAVRNQMEKWVKVSWDSKEGAVVITNEVDNA